MKEAKRDLEDGSIQSTITIGPEVNKFWLKGQVCPSLLFTNKVLWNPVMSIHLCTVYGWFHTTKAEMGNYGPFGLQSLKYVKVCWPLRSYMLVIITYPFIPRSYHHHLHFWGFCWKAHWEPMQCVITSIFTQAYTHSFSSTATSTDNRLALQSYPFRHSLVLWSPNS